MGAKQFAVLAGLAMLAGGVGCIRQCTGTYTECLRPVESVAAIAPQRAKVYVFLMNGADLFDLGQLHELEKCVVAAGFPKVYYAQRFDRDWYYKELHRLRRDDPDNRFVLVGQGTAADQVLELAKCVTADGIPLDAVLFLDPVGGKANLTEETPFPSAVLYSRLWPADRQLQTTQNGKVRAVGHLDLPTHPAAVDELVKVLTNSAVQVPDRRKPVVCIPLTDEPKPFPRPSEPKVVPPTPPEWDALCPATGHR